MFHTIVLLASSAPSMAVGAACACLLGDRAINHFFIYSNQPISELPLYKKWCSSFVLGSYESDLVMIPAPGDKSVRVHRSPEQLKSRYLAYVRKTVALVRDDQTLFLPLLAPCDAGLVHLGEGVSISLAELALALSSSRNVKLWMPECDDPCWRRPGLPWTVLDKVSPIHDRLRQAEPLNISPFILPKLFDEAPPYFKYCNVDLQTAKRLAADLEALIATLEPSKLDHPSDYLCYAVRHIRSMPTHEIPRSMHLHRIRDLGDVNRVGDILAHRLNCFMNVYVLSHYIFGTPLYLFSLADGNLEGFYWHWLEASCVSPWEGHYYKEFLETTQIPLPVLKRLVGTLGLFSDGYAVWQEPLFVLAIHWAKAGRPPVSVESLASAQLWRVAAFAPDVLQLVQVVAEACQSREEREEEEKDGISLEDCPLYNGSS